MQMFHRGGYEAAKLAIEEEYRTTLNALRSELEKCISNNQENREHLENEIVQCKQSYREALRNLRRGLF